MNSRWSGASLIMAGIATVAAVVALKPNKIPDWGFVVFLALGLLILSAGVVLATWPFVRRVRIGLIPQNGKATSVPGVEFYENREALERMTGGLVRELTSVKEAWLATYAGTRVETTGAYRLRKLTRLILLDPESAGFPLLAAEYDRKPDEVAGCVRTVTRLATDYSTEVRWCSGTITGMLIGDPGSDEGWARVEVAFPHSEHRTGFRVTRAQYPDLFIALKDSYVRLWGSANCRIPA